MSEISPAIYFSFIVLGLPLIFIFVSFLLTALIGKKIINLTPSFHYMAARISLLLLALFLLYVVLGLPFMIWGFRQPLLFNNPLTFIVNLPVAIVLLGGILTAFVGMKVLQGSNKYKLKQHRLLGGVFLTILFLLVLWIFIFMRWF